MEGFWFYFIFGFAGIIMHIAANVLGAGGRKLSAFIVYVKDNSLTVAYSVGAYVILAVLWQTEGFEFMGFVKGQLTGATALLAYVADSAFMKTVEARSKSKEEVKP